MERRKLEIEQEIAREKAHLAELQRLELSKNEPNKAKPKAVTQYESMVAQKMNLKSPSPPPVPPLPSNVQSNLLTGSEWDQVRLRKSRHANICSKNQFFHENVVVIGFSELRLESNERYENSTFYGSFRFLIF